jgi:hypothetical protein
LLECHGAFRLPEGRVCHTRRSGFQPRLVHLAENRG